MITLNKEELLSYKNSLLISFAPDLNSSYRSKTIDGVLSNIYTCIMKRKYSGTAQEKVDIATMGKIELAAILNAQR